jgi:hypothetical protein
MVEGGWQHQGGPAVFGMMLMVMIRLNALGAGRLTI